MLARKTLRVERIVSDKELEVLFEIGAHLRVF